MADLGVAQLHDMREHAEMIANLDPHGPPLIADMDTGYGGKFPSYRAYSYSFRTNILIQYQVPLWWRTRFSNTYVPE